MNVAKRLARLGRAWARRRQLRRALVGRADRHGGPIIEIGSLFGLTTRLIAAHAPAGRQVIAVDNLSWNPLALPREHDYGLPQFGVTRAVDKAFPHGIEVHGTLWSWERAP